MSNYSLNATAVKYQSRISYESSQIGRNMYKSQEVLFLRTLSHDLSSPSPRYYRFFTLARTALPILSTFLPIPFLPANFRCLCRRLSRNRCGGKTHGWWVRRSLGWRRGRDAAWTRGWGTRWRRCRKQRRPFGFDR